MCVCACVCVSVCVHHIYVRSLYVCISFFFAICHSGYKAFSIAISLGRSLETFASAIVGTRERANKKNAHTEYLLIYSDGLIKG